MNLDELYLKYLIKTDGLQRRYIVNTHDRQYDLDFVTPIELHVFVPYSWENDVEPFAVISNPAIAVLRSRSWVQLLKKLVLYLQSKNPKTHEELFAFKTDWSKAAIFSDYRAHDNMIEIEDRLFFSVNYTATHSSWIINDLLEFYDIHLAYLVLHRPPVAEPEEVKNEVGRMRREEFKKFLVSNCMKSEESANTIVNNLESINKVFARMDSSYNDLFLFDDPAMLSNYKSKFLKSLSKCTSWDETKIQTAHRYLDYLTDYYASVKKESSKHKEDLKLGLYII